MEIGVGRIMNQLNIFRSNVENVRKRLQGWCSEKKSRALIDTILEYQPVNCVEIGVFGGASLIPMTMALAAVGGEGRIYGIDPWEAVESVVGMGGEGVNFEYWKNLDYEAIYVGFLNELVKNSLTKYCIPLRMTSEKAASLFDNDIDLIHIDGNHSEERSWLDVELYYDKVKSGGIIIFDDIGWREKNANGTQKAVSFLDENCEILSDVADCRFYKKK